MSEALTKPQLSRYLRRHVRHELYGDWGTEQAGDIAIYSLADPRDLHEVRYIGQTSRPRRRFLQHLNTARLWLPDERPWWIKRPQMRPLYEWIRALYGEEHRLPTMVVCGWATGPSVARLAERARICECLVQNMPLLNIEAERNDGQLRLL